MTAPLFIEGIHWRKLTRDERNGRPWKYVLLADVVFPVEVPINRVYQLRDRDGILRGEIRPEGIVCKAGYSWNGCSWSPDFYLLSSLPHDLIYQFCGCSNFPAAVSRSWTDTLFQLIARAQGYIGLPWIYRGGLALGSWLFWRTWPKDGERVNILP